MTSMSSVTASSSVTVRFSPWADVLEPEPGEFADVPSACRRPQPLGQRLHHPQASRPGVGPLAIPFLPHQRVIIRIIIKVIVPVCKGPSGSVRALFVLRDPGCLLGSFVLSRFPDL
jgi:hypothetical protein